MPKKKKIDAWLAKKIAEVGVGEKLPPRIMQDNIDKCADIAIELKNKKNLSSEQTKHIFEGCVVATDLNGEPIESVKERLGIKSRRKRYTP